MDTVVPIIILNYCMKSLASCASLEKKIARTDEAAEDAGGVQDAEAIAHEEHAEHDDRGDRGAVEHLDAHHRRVLVRHHHPACIQEMLLCM